MMTSLQQTIGNLATSFSESVNSALGNTPNPNILSRSDVNKLEETERVRRLEQVSQTRVDKQNAANVSSLIRTQSFPVFRGNVSKGYKRLTTRLEEEERRRRLTNKSESALRRNNAHQTAHMIRKLGWPLYKAHDGPEYILMDPIKLLEEEEREWRTNDSYWTTTAKHNAATVANIVRWNSYQMNPRAGYRRHVAFLAEKERLDRLSPSVMRTAMENSYNESRLIKQLGAPFYVQAPLAKRDFSETHKLEEQERERRIHAPYEQQLARELAGAVSGHLNKDNEREERERGRRMKDFAAQKVAQENAKHVSLMVRESSVNKINGTAPVWFSISRNSMRALEEIERTRRMRDVDGQTRARNHAKLISASILHKWSQPTRSSNSLEEEERQSRILDRAQQQISIKNARKVSGLVAKHNLLSSSSKSFALALEESERSRRLQDREQQDLARDNAKKVSSLVSSLNVAPGRHISIRDAPLSPAKAASIPPTQALPAFHAPLSASPTTVNIPPTPVTASVEPYDKEAPAVLPTTLPLDSQRSSGELKRSESPLIAAAPITRSVSGPLSASQGSPSRAPLSSSPSIQPIVLPSTANPVPVAPLATAHAVPPVPVRQTSFIAPTVPVDSIAISHPAIGERQRKKLIKEAERHNKRSEKEVRKAEQSMLKAEKFHQQGRDDKALKLEHKAEHLMKNAEHERRWASGLQNEILPNAPAPASM